MDEDLADLLLSSLSRPVDSIGYAISSRLAAAFPDKAIVEAPRYSFDFDGFCERGLCEANPSGMVHTQTGTNWDRRAAELTECCRNGWLDVVWQDHQLQVVVAYWIEGRWSGAEPHFWVIAETADIAEAFTKAVCEYSGQVSGEILVFEEGGWTKSKELYDSIRDASFDKLVLAGNMKDEIRQDLELFLGAREMYEQYGVPWKRGIIFIGPPGNGKTFMIKALINHLKRPCLYVKSFNNCYGGGEHDNIHRVFNQARQTIPCLLVFEDLESLVDEDTRTFFLNELDGFAANTGIVTLATTNDPALLDPAILNRPSRFDRKYHFALPGPVERKTYLRMWNSSLQSELQFGEESLETLAKLTDGFSFAYLKELFLSSIMYWMSNRGTKTMVEVMTEQAAVLRKQAKTSPLPSGAGVGNRYRQFEQLARRCVKGRAGNYALKVMRFLARR